VIEQLRRLHEAQATIYAGGLSEPLKDLLAPDVVWHVPGDNPIAGVYEGVDSVLEYFARRRDIASGTFTIHPVDVLMGAGAHVAALTDGAVILQGVTRKWSTVGLYRFHADLVAACWLLPLDPREFDFIWTACFEASSGPHPGRARS
jgi:hypothetical protein